MTIPTEALDRADELKLRPQRLGEFIGQAALKDQLQTALKASLQRGEPLEHVLLYGPPGLGKTTLAQVIARELGGAFTQTSGPVLQAKGDLTNLLRKLTPKQVVFIDEVHRLRTNLEELLYPALEDFRLDLVVGVKVVSLDLTPFTLVAATTLPGSLSKPFSDRFGLVFQLQPYLQAELKQIAQRSAKVLGVELTEDAASVLARSCRATPRTLNRLLRRARDQAQVAGTTVDLMCVSLVLDNLCVDHRGLNELDRKVLRLLAQHGVLGVNNLAVRLGENTETYSTMIEPYLIEAGFVDRTPQGRELTERGRQHLKEVA